MINTAGAGVDGLTKYGSLWAVVEAAKAGTLTPLGRQLASFQPLDVRLSKGIHATGYAVGYGTTFPVVLVGRLLPKNNPVGYGCIDGGAAGLDLARQTLGYTTAAAAEQVEEAAPTLAIAGGQA